MISPCGVCALAATSGIKRTKTKANARVIGSISLISFGNSACARLRYHSFTNREFAFELSLRLAQPISLKRVELWVLPIYISFAADVSANAHHSRFAVGEVQKRQNDTSRENSKVRRGPRTHHQRATE